MLGIYGCPSVSGLGKRKGDNGRTGGSEKDEDRWRVVKESMYGSVPRKPSITHSDSVSSAAKKRRRKKKEKWPHIGRRMREELENVNEFG